MWLFHHSLNYDIYLQKILRTALSAFDEKDCLWMKMKANHGSGFLWSMKCTPIDSLFKIQLCKNDLS